MAKKTSETSWGKVADWYDEYLSGADTYQKEVVLPNLLRLLELKPTDIVLDVACGQGFFARSYHEKGVARVLGADVAPELIAKAKTHFSKGEFFAAPSHKLSFAKDGTADKISIVLAIQNIEKVGETFAECARVLKAGGKFVLAMNHPAFRVPRHSSWGFDEKHNTQYRRVDSYISETKTPIVMNPGSGANIETVSFHRPLQFYFKALRKAGFLVRTLEEWTSHKQSEPGPRQTAENRARKEFPMFLAIEAVKA